MNFAGGDAVAMLTWKDGGELSTSYVIVESVRLADRLREEVTLLVCSCDDNKKAKNRLLTLRRQSRPIGRIVDFETAEKTHECTHCALVRRLFPQVLFDSLRIRKQSDVF